MRIRQAGERRFWLDLLGLGLADSTKDANVEKAVLVEGVFLLSDIKLIYGTRDAGNGPRAMGRGSMQKKKVGILQLVGRRHELG